MTVEYWLFEKPNGTFRYDPGESYGSPELAAEAAGKPLSGWVCEDGGYYTFTPSGQFIIHPIEAKP